VIAIDRYGQDFSVPGSASTYIDFNHVTVRLAESEKHHLRRRSVGHILSCSSLDGGAWWLSLLRRCHTASRLLWRTAVRAENNTRVRIEDEHYFLSADGKLMPTRKDQPPPDLQYFNRKQR
jgi:hypothetical protein